MNNHNRGSKQRKFVHPGSWSISPGGSPKKGVNKANKEFSPKFSLKIRVLKLRFLAFTEGPGGFREVREAGRIHFHLSWYLLVPGITSYGQYPGGDLLTVYGSFVIGF